MDKQEIIIYNTEDGKCSVVLIGQGGMVWLSQAQMAELFATSKQSVSYHIANILKERELPKHAVVKEILTTAADGKQYRVAHYSLDMVLAVGYRIEDRAVPNSQFKYVHRCNRNSRYNSALQTCERMFVGENKSTTCALPKRKKNNKN